MGDAQRRDLPDAIHTPKDRPVVARVDRLNSTLSLDERSRDARVVEVTLTVAHRQ